MTGPARSPRRTALEALRHGERGDGPISAAIIVPIVMLITLGAIQTGMYFHARAVATSAAQVGVEDARTLGASAGAGQEAARRYLTEVAPTLMNGAQVTATRGAGTAQVTITAPAPSVVPGLPLPSLRATAVSPIEEVTRP